MTEPAAGLTDEQARMLAFEAREFPPNRPGLKMNERRLEFPDLSEIHYYFLLNRLIDTRAALEAAPGVVSRLRRIRDDMLKKKGGWDPAVGEEALDDE